MLGKVLTLVLSAKMLSANQIPGFFKLEYIVKCMWYQSDFLHVERYSLGLRRDDDITVGKFMHGCGRGQAFPVIPKFVAWG